MLRFAGIMTAVLVLGTAATAQTQNALSTPYGSLTACFGSMFDVVATTDITVCSFDVAMDAGTNTVEVWAVAGGGTWNVWNVSTWPSMWTQLASVTVTSAGSTTSTPLLLNLGHAIPAGATQGFYITTSSPTVPWIRQAVAPPGGGPVASNADLAILTGASDCSGGGFAPSATRGWVGTIHYQPGLSTSCTWAPPSPEFQVNQTAAWLTINGQNDPGPWFPIRHASLLGVPESLTLASVAVGMPWDVGIVVPGAAPGLSGGGVPTAGGQTVNLDLGASSLTFLNGGVLPNIVTTAFPNPAFGLPFIAPLAMVGSAQMIVVDPAALDGFSLSHAVEYTAGTCAPQQDFDNLSLGLGVAPPGWINGAAGLPWTVHTGVAPPLTTGPLAAASFPNYIYCDNSPPNATAVFTLETCAYPLTLLSQYTVEFKLNRNGAGMGSLQLWMDDGTGTFAVPLVGYLGNGLGSVWSQESVPFVPPVTGFVAFRFTYVGGGVVGFVAIDDFDLL